MTIAQVLRRCHLFAGLKDEQIAEVLPLCAQTTALDGGILFKQGGPATSLYVVETGNVALEMSVFLTHPVLVARVGPGEALGWSALLEPHVMTLSAKAMGPGPCSLVKVEGAGLRSLLERRGDIASLVWRGLAELLAHRLTQTRQALVHERGWADAP
ncbi:MAG: cyclic nucleotide-binding domain-containing protein [Chloroflexota bacterium]|nr:cyclic nucleotide-binding domain-containing protein [Chloroflexota bacterium]